MAQLATKITRTGAGRAGSGAIDRGHLARMTFGDRSLEREVLQLFDRQAALLMARMRGGEPATVATLAHTLKGSAASIGAAGVVRAAARGRAGRGEVAAANARSPSTGSPRAIDAARAAIADDAGRER